MKAKFSISSSLNIGKIAQEIDLVSEHSDPKESC